MRKYELNHFGSIVFMLFLVFVTTTAVRAQDVEQGRRSEKWAVLIGVDDYAYAKDLKYCGADMQGLQKELTSVGFDARQVLLLNDGATEKRLQPYKSNIEKQIELTCSNAERGDLVLIAFSGHGVHADKVSYFCPTDAKLDDRSTLISLDWVYEKLQKCEADLKLVMVDACRNVPAELNNTRDFTAEERKDRSRAFTADAERLPQGILLLSSCSEGEFAQEDVEFGQGVFMHFVLEGIRGKADTDRDKAVTLNELFRFASKETKLHVSTKFSDSQRPKLKGNLTVEALDFEIVSPGQRATIADEITNSIGMKLKLIRAGEFLMGSPDNETGRYSFETQHRVKLTTSYYLGVTEVTQGQWFAMMQTKPWSGKEFAKEGEDYPATNVSWDDAVEYSATLSAAEGKTYRLPTDAEWEYACRGGKSTAYSFGSDATQLKDYAWTRANTPNIRELYAHEVGTKQSNPFGLYDMHGNVREWCSDFMADYDSSSAVDPSGPLTGSHRVIRGGYWASTAKDCRSARRFVGDPTDRSAGNCGFRLALSPSVK